LTKGEHARLRFRAEPEGNPGNAGIGTIVVVIC
jgi:hypothetical protein